MNSRGVTVSTAKFAGRCGAHHPFVYFPHTRKYVVLHNPPGSGTVDTSTLGIADDNSVEVSAWHCRSHRTSIYRVRLVGSTPHWSRPCTCYGYRPVGINLDGIGLNSRNHGPSILTFPRGTPKIAPLPVKSGSLAQAHIDAVGTPGGFVGFEYDPALGDAPTVWLRGKPHQLPLRTLSPILPTPAGLAEVHTSAGLQIDVVATCYCDQSAGRIDFWRGERVGGRLTFSEKPSFVKSKNLNVVVGMSTDGSMLFGNYNGDSGDGLIIYFVASRSERSFVPGCSGNFGWGDSRGDILGASFDSLCIAERRA